MEPLTLAYILIVAGLLLLVAELFIPSGLFFVVAISAIVGGVVMVFIYGNEYNGWIVLLGLFVVVPSLGGLVFHYWPKSRMGRRFFLHGPAEDATMASMPVNVELEQLRGRLGRTLSPLRPAGVVDFNGKRVDTITEGMMIDAGQWVRCIDVKAGKVVVREVDPPDLSDLENADFG